MATGGDKVTCPSPQELTCEWNNEELQWLTFTLGVNVSVFMGEKTTPNELKL